MAATPVIEKPLLAVPITTPATQTTSHNALLDTVVNVYNGFQERRAALGLSNPGSVDNIAKEVQREVFLTNQTFSGLRAELNKSFSISPVFQISHAFASGSQQLSPYTFLALFGTNNTLCQAQLDSDASLSARFNQRITNRFTVKSALQVQPASMAGPGGSQLSLEQEYIGNDFSASLKSINPSVLEGGVTGMFIGSYLQSITPRLSLGLEGIWQKQSGMGPEAAISYAGRYKGDDWIGSLQLLTQGGLHGAFWKRISERVDAGIDVNLQLAQGNPMMGGPAREGSATFGAKYEFSRSIFRAQVDSKGKIGCLLEKVVAPPVRVTFAGELDHAKSQAKVGLAVSIEAGSEELQEQSQTISPASPPF